MDEAENPIYNYNEPFYGAGEELSAENIPQSPAFPIGMLMFGAIKDLLDVLSLGILGMISSVFFGLVIWIWVFFKPVSVKKRLTPYFVRRWGLGILVGIIPWLNFWPESTMLVWRTYKKEKKIVDDFREQLGTIE